MKDQILRQNNIEVLGPPIPNEHVQTQIQQTQPRGENGVADSVQTYIKHVVTESIGSTHIPEMISKEINRNVRNVETDAAHVAEKSCEEVMRTFGIERGFEPSGFVWSGKIFLVEY